MCKGALESGGRKKKLGKNYGEVVRKTPEVPEGRKTGESLSGRSGGGKSSPQGQVRPAAPGERSAEEAD